MKIHREFTFQAILRTRFVEACIVLLGMLALFAFLFFTPAAEASESESPILIAMPGSVSGQRAYVEKIEDTGLLRYCDFALQINGGHTFPEDFESPRSMFDSAYDKTAYALRNYVVGDDEYDGDRLQGSTGWSPEPFVYVYFDYEPRVDGRPWWPGRTSRGFLPEDLVFVEQSLAGVRAAIEDHGEGVVAEGADVSFYYLPTFPRSGRFVEDHYSAADQFADIAEHQDLIWYSCYPTRDGVLTEDEMRDAIVRFGDVRDIAADYGDQEVILGFWFKWSAGNQPDHDIEDWTAFHLTLGEMVFRSDLRRIVIWSNPSGAFFGRIYGEYFEQAKDPLKRFVRSRVDDWDRPKIRPIRDGIRPLDPNRARSEEIGARPAVNELPDASDGESE